VILCGTIGPLVKHWNSGVLENSRAARHRRGFKHMIGWLYDCVLEASKTERHLNDITTKFREVCAGPTGLAEVYPRTFIRTIFVELAVPALGI
jgi:hypothetical protein